MPPKRTRTAAGALLVLALCVGAAAGAVGAPQQYQGRLLADALRLLQAAGLRIVFSSELVTREMRVAAEPRAHLPLDVLDELLKPHGLKAERGPGRVLQIVRAAPPASVDPPRPPVRPVTPKTPESQVFGPAYAESVQVTAGRLDDPHRGVGSEISVGRADLENLRGVLSDDPVRAAQSLPGVAAASDFRSELSVRGSSARHIGVVVDGVATPWLRHAAYGRGDAGSIAMVGIDALEQVTLQAAAYPQRYGDWLGAQLSLTLRHGSRTGRRLRTGVNGTSAAILAEGPIGRAQRGSWLISARQSYLDWPAGRSPAPDGTAFGFADAHAKLVYDVRPRQQIAVSLLGGRSGIDGPDDRPPGELANGTNRAGLLSVRWDSTFGARTRVTQRAHVVSHQFLNKHQSGQDAARGSNGELSYRVDLVRSVSGGLFEAGAQWRRSDASRQWPSYGSASASGRLPLEAIDGFDETAYGRSAYVNIAWMPSRRLTITPGLRVSGSTLTRRPVLGRWVLGEWTMREGWTLNASAGISHQLPELQHAFAAGREARLRPERASHAALGVAQHFGPSLRWRAGVFHRRERDVLREWDVLAASRDAQYENALTGSSNGVELLLERRATTGPSGWAAYSYGRTRYHDTVRDEVFWADFDQRHSVNAHASFALSERTRAAMTLRGGTNFPIPFRAHTRDTLHDARTGATRLPPYARLDALGERAFHLGGRRVTIFVEVINVLNRTNMGLVDGMVQPLLPRLPSAGMRIEF